MGKAGSVINIIGRTESGKTPIAQRIAEESGLDVVAYDPNYEHPEDKYTIYHSLADFKEFVTSDECRGCAVICEEATTFVSSFKDMELQDWLVKVAHKNNLIIFLFHSLMDTPPFILRKSHYAILLPTNDEPIEVERQRRKFYKYFLESRENYRPDVVGSGDVYIDLNEV